MKKEPSVTIYGILDMQVCVPKDWTDEQVLLFAAREYPVAKWEIRKAGSPYLEGYPERMPCEKLKGFVHIMLDEKESLL